MPGYIFDRISDGLIFDIYKVKGYEQPFGFALQDYVRDITNRLIENSMLEAQEGAEYYIKKNKKHGTDLYLFDDSTAMLIECKARRFNLKSKYQGNDAELIGDLKLMAKFIVQNYKNLTDVINKYTPWNSSDRTLYPVVVTLMDCYIWTPTMLQKLDNFIIEKMVDANLDTRLKENYPYFIMSVADYELSVQIIRQVGMQTFFNDKKQDAYLGWSVESFIMNQYGAALENCRTDYLKSEFDELVNRFSLT